MKRLAAPTALVVLALLVTAAAGFVGCFGRRKTSDLRQRVLDAALAEPSIAPRVDSYWQDALAGASPPYPPDWCGAFVLWALHQAGLAKDVTWTISKGFASQLPTTENPEPGDVAYFAANQHHALVLSVSPSQVTLLNGNGSQGHITRSTVPRNEVAVFYSIEPLLRDAG